MGFKGLIISALGIFVLASTRSAMADPIDDAVAADRIGDFGAALAIIRPLVDQGNPSAQAILAEMYTNGHAGRVDFQEAERLVFQSVRKGDREGRSLLALMYKNGWGVQQDELAASYWSELASNNPPGANSPASSAQPDNPCLQTLYSSSDMTRGEWMAMLRALCKRPETHGKACQEIFANPQKFDAGITRGELQDLLAIFCS